MKTGFWERVWQYFSSIKVAIFVMAFIAVACIFGSVIEQHGTEARYVTYYGRMAKGFYENVNAITSKIGVEVPVFSESYYIQTRGQRMYEMLEKAGMHDLYHSWWFMAGMIVFCLHLISATVNTMPGVWRRVMRPRVDTPAKTLKRLERSETFQTVGQGAEKSIETAVGFFRSKRFHVQKKTGEGGEYLLAQKGRLRFLGPYVVHVSILVIFAGALVGGFYGGDEYRPIIEGTTMAIPDSDLVLRVNDFEVEYNEHYQPTEYVSNVDVIKDGKSIRQHDIKVNHPLRIAGKSFYQSSFGWIIELRAEDSETGRTIKNFTLFDGDTFYLPEKGMSFEMSRFFPDLVITTDGYRSMSPEAKNPAVYLRVFKNNRVVTEGIVSDARTLKAGGVTMAWKGVRHYTGLQMARDPGVPLIWAGFMLMIVGLCLCFYLFYRQIWFFIGKDGEAVVAGKAHRFPQAFAEEFERVAGELKKALSSGDGESKGKRASVASNDGKKSDLAQASHMAAMAGEGNQ